MSSDTRSAGQYDEFLSAEVEMATREGREVWQLHLADRLRTTQGLGLREATRAVQDFCARNCPDLTPRMSLPVKCLGIMAGCALMLAVFWLVHGFLRVPTGLCVVVETCLLILIAVVLQKLATGRRPKQ